MASVAHWTARVMQAMWIKAWPRVEMMMAGWNRERRGLVMKEIIVCYSVRMSKSK